MMPASLLPSPSPSDPTRFASSEPGTASRLTRSSPVEARKTCTRGRSGGRLGEIGDPLADVHNHGDDDVRCLGVFSWFFDLSYRVCVCVCVFFLFYIYIIYIQ